MLLNLLILGGGWRWLEWVKGQDKGAYFLERSYALARPFVLASKLSVEKLRYSYHILIFVNHIPAPSHSRRPSTSNQLPDFVSQEESSQYHRLLLAHNNVCQNQSHENDWIRTLCFQSESDGRTTFSCSGPPYRRRSNAKLARSATVTEVPADTPVTKNALNGNGIDRKAGKRLLARAIPDNPMARPTIAPFAPWTKTYRLGS